MKIKLLKISIKKMRKFNKNKMGKNHKQIKF